MLKLIGLLQLLMASGHAAVKSPWPQRLMRRIVVVVSLLVTGTILSGILISAGLLWGYETAIANGYSTDQVMISTLLVVLALLIAVGIGLNYAVKEIKAQFTPHVSEAMPVTAHIAHTVQDAVKGFARGFIYGRRIR